MWYKVSCILLEILVKGSDHFDSEALVDSHPNYGRLTAR